MALLISVPILLVIEVALATYVATRAWNYRPARLFVLTAAFLITSNSASLITETTTDLTVAYAGNTIAVLTLAGYQFAQLLLFSALFVPQWWRETRPIRWISLPYLLVLVAMCIDLPSRAGIFVDGGRASDIGYSFNLTRPAGQLLMALFIVSWLVLMSILVVAFIRERHGRKVVGLLFLAILFDLTLLPLSRQIEALRYIPGLIYTIPILLALAYAVIRSQLLVPTQAGLDLALRAMSEVVVVVDQGGLVVYANPPAAMLGFQPEQSFVDAMRVAGATDEVAAHLDLQRTTPATPTTRQTLTLGARQLALSLAPIADQRGHVRGTLLLGRDVTEVERYTVRLEQEQVRLAATVQLLEAEQRERAQLAATVQALSLPLIPVLEGVLVLPLIGTFDLTRADAFVDVLLQGIERERARIVLIDLTGIPLLDTKSAASVLRGCRAASLLGARCVLVGVRPEIAQALVAFNVSLGELKTAATLQQALQSELLALSPAQGGMRLRAARSR
jgi:rsbT co-antagonist protein RsbR